MAAGIINENSTHHLRRDGEKVRPVIPFNISLIDESDKCFVDQCRSLKRVAGSLAIHVVVSKTVELAVDQRRHAVKGRTIAFAPIMKQLGYVSLSVLVHRW